MPLPKEYFEALKTGNRPLSTPTTISSSPGISYPDLTPDIVEEAGNAWGGVGDFLWTAGEGFTSGMTWGVSDLADVTGQEPWEEMTSTEKAGWILGEGGSFFVPYYGPFSLLGKGARYATKAFNANKYVGKAAKKAVESGTRGLQSRASKAILKAKEEGVNVSDDIIQGINKVAHDDLGVRWIKDLSAKGTAGVVAHTNLLSSTSRAVMKAFDKAGIKGVADRDATKIAKEFIDNLGKGDYVNDVAEWVTRGLVNTNKIPLVAGNFMSKYLGMVTQDLYMMGVHGLISGKIKSLASGEDFDATGALSHAALMSLGFPLIRKIWNIPGMGKGRGGVASIGTGVKAYANIYKKTNYEAIRVKHGDDVVKNLLRVMVKGSKRDLLSRSEVFDASFKAGGKTYTNGTEVLAALPNMATKDAITLLNKINLKVNKSLLKKWGPDFLTDLAGSLPRMGVGVVAMNPWVLNKDAWGTMEGPELASHLFMAAVMTKGRGAWGHSDKRAYFADFTPYHEVLQVLGVDVSNVNKVLRFHDGKAIELGLGMALDTHETGRDIVKIFDKTISEESRIYDKVDPDTGKRVKGYNAAEHGLVFDMGTLYNIIKDAQNPGTIPINIENMNAKVLNTLVRRLEGITFNDGVTVKDVGYAGALAKITASTSKRGLNIYKEMLKKLADELRYEISISDEGIVNGSLIKPSRDGDTYHEANTVNRILLALEGIGEAKVSRQADTSDAEHVNYEKIVAKSKLSKKAFEARTGEIIHEYMDILGREFNDRNIMRDPILDNPIFRFFKQAKFVETSERVYNIANGKFPSGDKFGDGSFLQGLDNLFRLPDGRYAMSIDAYKANLKKGLIEKPKDEAEEKHNAKIMEEFEFLRPIFDLRKRMIVSDSGVSGGVSNVDVLKTRQIDMENVSTVYNQWLKIYKSLPPEWKSDGSWYSHVRNLYLERYYKAKGVDSRAFELITFMHDRNMILSTPGPEGKLKIYSEEALMDEVKAKYPKQVDEYRDAFRTIKQILGKDLVEEVPFQITDSTSKGTQEVQLSDYIRAAKKMSGETMKDLMIRTQELIKEIETADEGTRKEIHSIFEDTRTIINHLDPANKKDLVKNAVGEMDKISDKIESLRTRLQKKDLGEGQTETERTLDQLSVDLVQLVNEIDTVTNKFRISPKKIGAAEGGKEELYEVLSKSVQTNLEKLFEREAEGIDKIKELTKNLYSLVLKNESGLGLTKSEAAMIIENLSREWFTRMGDNKRKGVQLLSEIVNDVNKNGFFADAIKLIEAATAKVNETVVLNREHNLLNDEATKRMKAMEEGNKTHEHQLSVKEILNEYGLIDKRNQEIKKSFVNAILADNKQALVNTVRKAIFADKDKTTYQKNTEWRKFRSKHAPQIINYINSIETINKVSIKGVVQDGQTRASLDFENNSPTISHPNNKYFMDKGFKVHYINDTISVDIGKGRLRNVSLDSYPDAAVIQNLLNISYGESTKITKKMLEDFQQFDSHIRASDLKELIKTFKESPYFFYIRLSPANKIMFAGSKDNLNKLDAEFKTWYNEAIVAGKDSRFTGKEREVFINLFKHLLSEPNTDVATVTLKMMLPYLDYTGNRSEINKLIAEYSSAEGSRPSKLAKIGMNIWKRGYLSDGGTTQPIQKATLEWMSRYSPHGAARIKAASVLRNGGWRTAVLDDVIAEDINTHPLNINSMEHGNLNKTINNVKAQATNKNVQWIGEIAETQKQQLGDTNSLMNSLFDGAKFASYNTMRLIMAEKGMLTNDFSDSPNGAKTVIFSVGNNQMLGKGYMIYHPDIAAQMGNVDIMLGKTSAKTFDGMDITGQNRAKALDLTRLGKDWLDPNSNQSIGKNISQENIMLLPIEAIGVSFTSKNESGVAISPSIFDFQPKTSMEEAVMWMGLEAKLKDIAVQWNNVYQDGGKLANYMYDLELSKGNPLDKGNAGITKLIFTYGAMPNNPWVQTGLKRLLRSSQYKLLSKHINQHGGEDNFIVPNIAGDLSTPLYAELWNKHITGRPGTELRERVSVNYGGIGLNKHTASRLMGKDTNLNLEGERFIFTDENGVDVVISIEGGKYEIASTYYDSLFENAHYKTKEKVLDSAGNWNGIDYKDTLIEVKDGPNKLAMGKGSKYQQVISLLNVLKGRVNKKRLSFEDVFKLLNGEQVKGEFLAGKSVVNKDLNLQLGVLSHAVPVIGHDKVILRVQKILEGMQGLTEVNVHDLRAVMQRDNDGDHLFTHTNNIPWNSFKGFMKENGRKSDFNMFDATDVLNRDYINMFGIEEGVAGQIKSAVGFQGYANKMADARMLTGQIVGARGALSYLNKLGLQLDGVNLVKDFTSPHDMASGAWKALDKYYDIMQNGLDIFGGIHPALKENVLRNFVFFGKSGIADRLNDPHFNKHNKEDINLFHEKHRGFGQQGSGKNPEIQREIFYEILRTLKKSNMIQNDTWDEKGSRSPEPFEVRDAYYDMKSFFENPTRYLMRKLAKRISWESNVDKKSKLATQYADMFYVDKNGKPLYELGKESGRRELYKNIIDGNLSYIMPNEKFTFKNINTASEGFALSLGARTVSGLSNTQLYWQVNYDGIKSGNKKIYNAAGHFVKNIENFVEAVRMFGMEDPLKVARNLDIDVSSFGQTIQVSGLKDALHNGILRQLLQRQHANVMGSLEFFRGERFTNRTKMEKLQSRLANLQTAMNIMDEQLAKRMVIKSGDLQYQKADESSKEISFEHLKEGQIVHVYRIKGDVQASNEKVKDVLSDYVVDKKIVDHGQLDFVGSFKKGDKSEFMWKGHTYIIDRKPIQHVLLGSNERRYSMALFKATYGNNISPEVLVGPDMAMDFRDDVRRLRTSISMDYSKTIENALSNKVLSEGFYAIQASKEGHAIKEFIKKWSDSLASNDSASIENVFRYILQPRLSPGSYTVDKNNNEMPVYKADNHLAKVLINYAMENGQKGFVKRIMKDIEEYASGRNEEIDITSYEHARMDRVDWDRLGKMANPYRTLAKHLNIFFASPTLQAKLDGVLIRNRNPVETIRGNDGQLIPVRRQQKKPTAGTYWQDQTTIIGKPC